MKEIVRISAKKEGKKFKIRATDIMGDSLGEAEAEKKGEALFINMVYVAEQERGRRIGSRLLWSCEDVATQTGVRAMTLLVDQEDLQKQKVEQFYLRLGFERGRFEGNGSLRMVKFLPPIKF